MNPDEHQHELTAYALGELTREEEAAMRTQIAASPEMQAELAGIESVTDALQHGAPVPMEKLHPHQRQAILAPAKGPRFITPMMPQKKATAPRVFRFAPFFAGVTKVAAVIALTGAAFYLGHRSSVPGETTSVAATGTASPSEALRSEQPAATPAAPSPVIQAVAIVEKKPDPKPLSSTPPPAPAVAEIKTEAKAPPAPAPAAPQPAIAATASVSPPSALVPPPAADEGFIPVNRTAVAKVALRPHDTLPLPPKTAKGPLLASPSRPSAPEAKKDDRAAKRPDFLIDSWKAEVATCPWNPAHKLLRILVQSPAGQAAASSPDFEFPLQVSFDPLAVRSYRLISKSSHAPSEGGTTALQVLWYQIVPNGNGPDLIRENGRTIAAITMANSRFKSPPIDPFDNSTKLQAIDRGMKWDSARDDFLLETAIVGFGLLLRGEQSIGKLDHELVLRIARQARGADTSGERARFIKLVQDARRITGI